MHSVNGSQLTGTHRRNRWSTENHPRPALGVRIWTRLLAALHESRKQEAARVIRRHRDHIQNDRAIDRPGRGMDPKAHA
jgi:ribonuclease HI